MPGMTALHGNKRNPGMFAPFGGRFAEPTEENINLYNTGQLEVDLPDLDPRVLRSLYTPPEELREHSYSREVHPVTQTSATYCAVDRFHKHNIKTNSEKLRDIDIVKQLKGNLNTQVDEQLFQQLGKDLYFLNMLTPYNYLFILRLVLHLHNETVTKRQIQKATEAFKKFDSGTTAEVGPDCRLYLTSGEFSVLWFLKLSSVIY